MSVERMCLSLLLAFLVVTSPLKADEPGEAFHDLVYNQKAFAEHQTINVLWLSVKDQGPGAIEPEYAAAFLERVRFLSESFETTIGGEPQMAKLSVAERTQVKAAFLGAPEIKLPSWIVDLALRDFVPGGAAAEEERKFLDNAQVGKAELAARKARISSDIDKQAIAWEVSYQQNSVLMDNHAQFAATACGVGDDVLFKAFKKALKRFQEMVGLNDIATMLVVNSSPQGATVFVNNVERPKKTPCVCMIETATAQIRVEMGILPSQEFLYTTAGDVLKFCHIDFGNP